MKAKPELLRVRIDAAVLRQIRQHARSSMSAEICGVLIGEAREGETTVGACIPGEQARQGGSHVTFTQETWTHIYGVKDKLYPEKRMVGWYHSHPGFGVFLSDHDTFIHRNFFNSPNQIAWVYDPHSDEEGCFAWQRGQIVRVMDYSLHDEGGSVSGEEPDAIAEPADAGSGSTPAPSRSGAMKWVGLVLTHLFAIILGFGIAALVLPEVILVPAHGVAGQEVRK